MSTSTSKITSFDSGNIKEFRGLLEENLKEFGEKHGITVKTSGSIRYTPKTVTVTVTAGVVGEDGEEKSKDAHDFVTYGKRLGLQPEWLEQKVNIYGDWFTIKGLKLKAPKNNVLCEKVVGGKIYVIPHTAVIQAMK